MYALDALSGDQVSFILGVMCWCWFWWECEFGKED